MGREGFFEKLMVFLGESARAKMLKAKKQSPFSNKAALFSFLI